MAMKGQISSLGGKGYPGEDRGHRAPMTCGSTTIPSNLLKLKSAGIDSLMIWCTTPGDVTNIFTAIQQLQLTVPDRFELNLCHVSREAHAEA